MKIEQEIQKAQEITDKLIKYIAKANKSLEKCNIGYIDLTYRTDRLILQVEFTCPNNVEMPLKSFICETQLY